MDDGDIRMASGKMFTAIVGDMDVSYSEQARLLALRPAVSDAGQRSCEEAERARQRRLMS